VFIVALTGGIASGKSTVANYFAELGVAVIDADQIAHKLLDGPEIQQQIVNYYGQSVLTRAQQLNRAQLRETIFSNNEARTWLEQLLHPLIYKEIQISIQSVKSAYCLIVIPLLFEERTTYLSKAKPKLHVSQFLELNRVLLISTSQALQLQRVKERDNLLEKQIQAILSVQIPPTESVNKADDIIYNKTNLSDLRQSVMRFHHMYLSFAYSRKFILEQSAFLSYYLALK
jgi:dephospho-CoA kinase